MLTRRRPSAAAATAVVLAALVATSCYRIDGARLLDGSDAPDPSGVRTADGRLVVFSTQANGLRVQRIVFGPDDRVLDRGEALAGLAPWMSGGNLWAPDVARLGAGWGLYFAADTRPGSGRSERCIGLARSAALEGSYVPDAEPVVCSTNPDDEFIDPSVFDAVDGRWLLFRRGSNRWTRHAILAVPLDRSGRPTAFPSVLVDAEDGVPASTMGSIRRIENPQMFRDPRSGLHVLMVSAANWMDSSYRTIWFACGSPTSCNRRAAGARRGPYADLLASRAGLDGPGGMSIVRNDGGSATRLPAEVLFHALVPGTSPIRRSLWLAQLTNS